ncbi:MAG TPA: hypothetical protein VMU89_04730 [Thermomicrobiaceae bacterium]|nr:hypothetical protein [Thermomicrobiaceae bacterium]
MSHQWRTGRQPTAYQERAFAEDPATRAEAGVDEMPFDAGFLDDVHTADDYARWVERLRAWRP